MQRGTKVIGYSFIIALLVSSTLFVLATGPVSGAPSDFAYTTNGGNATVTGYNGTEANITIPSTLGGYPTTAIGDSAFYNLIILKSVIIPNSVKSIGNLTFDNCTALASVTIGAGVTTIGNYAFDNCTSLTNITFLGLTPPTVGVSWINGTNPSIYGHARANSTFPAPGASFYGLTMDQPPNVPTGLQAEAGNSQVKLTWTAPTPNGGSAIEYYIIFQGGAGLSSHPTGTTSVVTGLANGNNYSFTVAAVNAAGPSGQSGPVTSIPFTVPNAPTGLSAVSGNAKVTLNWTAPSFDGGRQIDHYVIYQDGVALAAQPTGMTANVTGLTNGEVHSFAVAAHNLAGMGANSSSVSSAADIVPGVPNGLTANAGNVQTSLNWTAPSPNGGTAVTGYKVYRSATQTGGYTLVSSPEGTTYIDLNGLTNGQTYWYEVSAVNAVGEGPVTVPISSIPFTVPNAPTGLTAVPGNASITLNWTAPFNGGRDIDHYVVYQNGSALTGQPTGLTVDITGLTNGMTYSFTVAAHNTAGNGTQSGTVSSVPNTVAEAPTGLATVPGNSQVILNWTAPTNHGGSQITGYKVYRSITQNSGYVLVASPTGVTYTDTVLINGQTYWYEVSVVNGVGEGPKTVAVSSIPFTVPGVPTGLAITAGNAKVTLNWTAPFDEGRTIDYYIVYQDGVDVVHTSQVTVTIVSLLNGHSYSFKVAAHNVAGNGPNTTSMVAFPSDKLMISITSPAGGSFLKTSSIDVKWNVSNAPSGIKRTELSIDAGTLLVMSSGAEDQPLSDLADGSHIVVVTVYDNAGNVQNASVRFTVDTVKPYLKIVSPVPSSWSNATSQNIVWTSTDLGSGIAYYLVKLDSGPWYNLTVQNIEFIGLTSAQHIADVRAYDRSGNYNETAWLFFVDTGLPTVGIVTPVQNSLRNSSTVSVSWTGEDTSGIAVYFVRIDGGDWLDMSLNTTHSFTSLTDGDHVITVKAQDNAGNWNQRSVTFVVDTVAPTVTAHSPTGSSASISTSMSASIGVSFSEKMNSSSVRIFVNGVNGTLSSSDNKSFTSSFTLAYDLACTVNVTGRDLAGNPVECSWSFTTMKKEGFIEGVIRNAAGDYIANATVTLSNGMTATTDSSGHFMFSNVTAGSYVLKVDKDGFQPFSQNVSSTAGQINNLGSISFLAIGSTSDGGMLIAAVTIMVIAILVLVFVIRRKGPIKVPGKGVRSMRRGLSSIKNRVKGVFGKGGPTSNEKPDISAIRSEPRSKGKTQAQVRKSMPEAKKKNNAPKKNVKPSSRNRKR
jgi:hypothetical protein